MVKIEFKIFLHCRRPHSCGTWQFSALSRTFCLITRYHALRKRPAERAGDDAVRVALARSDVEETTNTRRIVVRQQQSTNGMATMVGSSTYDGQITCSDLAMSVLIWSGDADHRPVHPPLAIQTSMSQRGPSTSSVARIVSRMTPLSRRYAKKCAAQPQPVPSASREAE